MTLGSMRPRGVRGLFVTCQHCGHERAVNMNDWPGDAVPIRYFPRFGICFVDHRQVPIGAGG
jgi:hypothetical protein